MVGDMTDAQRRYIGDIFNSGQHLLSLINDILDLSKVEAGMMLLELEAVDLDELLSNSLLIVREQAALQRIQLKLETEADFGVLELDRRKTKQIVYNLLANAVKFSEPGGWVTSQCVRCRVHRWAFWTATGQYTASRCHPVTMSIFCK